MAEFVTARWPEAEMPKTGDKPKMLARVRGFLRDGEKGRVREIGDERWGIWRPQAEAIERILLRVDRLGVGPRVLLQRERDREILSIREISTVPDLGAAPAIEEIHAAVWDEFEVRSGGLFLCRFVDGTRTVSKHGYVGDGWRGAAEDVFVLAGGMPELVDVAEFVVDRTKRGDLSAATVIVDQDIWTPGSGWRVYGGQRHFHTHVDVAAGSACNP